VSSAPIRIDLNAYRVARAERNAAAGRVPPVLTLGEPPVDYTLPAYLPIAVVADFGALSAGDITRANAAFSGILGAEGAQLVALLDYDEFNHIVEQVSAFYGLDEGESPASAPSS
jgi:hypothetical protein